MLFLKFIHVFFRICWSYLYKCKIRSDFKHKSSSRTTGSDNSEDDDDDVEDVEEELHAWEHMRYVEEEMAML